MSIYDQMRTIDINVDINYNDFPATVKYTYNIDGTVDRLVTVKVNPENPDFPVIDITYIVLTSTDFRYSVIESIYSKIYADKRGW